MANVDITVPKMQWYRVVSIYAQYSTSGVAGSRQVYCAFQDTSGNSVVFSAPASTQGASTVGYYWWAPLAIATGSSISGAVLGTGSIPDMLLAPGYSILVGVFGADSADAWQQGQVLAEVYTQDTTTNQLVPATPTVPLAV